MRFYRKFLCFVVALVMALTFSYPPSATNIRASGSFIEDFKSALYKDNTATTANWDTIAGKLVLDEGPFSFDLNSTDNLPEGTKVAVVKFNGNYWLIGGYTGISETIAPVLYSYSGPYDGSGTWTDLTSNISGMDVVSALGWNGTYWLIGGIAVGDLTETVLYSYNGSDWTDLSSYIYAQGSGVGLDAILNITWNGTFWMLGGMPVSGDSYLYSYEGDADSSPGTWTDLSGHIPDIDPLTDDVIIFSTAWNGTYWMVGGLAFRDAPDNSGPVLLSYSGGSDGSGTWIDLSSNIFNSVDGTGLLAAISIGWNGTYWLIGGFAIDNSDLYSYVGDADGSGTWTPINVGLSFFSFISGIGWNEEDNYWIIGGGNFLILEALSFVPGMEVLSKSVESMTAVEDPPDENLDIALYYYNGDASGNGTWLDFSGSVQDVVISTIDYDTENNYWLLGGFNFFLEFSSPALYSLVIGGYGNSDLAVSNDVAVTQNLIGSATLNYTGNLNGQQVVFYLSVDGGVTWEQVTPGVEHIFHSGKNLRWKATLITYNPQITPEITGVSISYTEREELPYTGK